MSALRSSVGRYPRSPRHFIPTQAKVRFSSSGTGDAAQKKAHDALASLRKNGERLWAGTVKFLGPVGERAGSMLGAYREPLVYNLSITREILKHIYITERLQPPTSLSVVQSAYATLWSRASSPAYWRQIASSGEWARVGLYAVEAYGIFKIGEILGRRSLVGYNLH